MKKRNNILVVDDEVMNQHILLDLLEDEFNLEFANNGQECLDSIDKSIPDIILLDVNMPVLDGLKTCEIIKKNKDMSHVPIIFISALASPKERLAGYQVGGDDYLTKPFEEDELKAKIHILLKLEGEISQGKLATQQAINKAITTITKSDEIVAILHFMQSLLTSQNIEQVLVNIAEVLASLKVQGCVMLAHKQPPTFIFTDGKSRPIEQVILKETHQDGEIIEFSNKAIFNSEHAAILIRCLPEDEEKNNRFKQHISTLLNALDAKLAQLLNQDKAQQHYLALGKTIKSVAVRLKTVKQVSQQQRAFSMEVWGDLVPKIENTFKQALDEDEEKNIREVIELAEKKSALVYQDTKKSENVITEIFNDLCRLLAVNKPK